MASSQGPVQHGDDRRTAAPPGSWRRRLIRHYVPLAAVTGAVLVVLVSVPFFDANRYPPPPDIFAEGVEGAWPSGDYPPTSSPSTAGHAATMGGRLRHGGRPGAGHAPATDGSTPAGGSVSPDHAGDPATVLRMRRLTTMTGYVATVLIALTLLVGPASLVLGRRLPVSSYLRRDIGIWAAVTSVVHVVLGLLVKHGDGQILSYFLEAGDRGRVLTNSFGLANWVGLVALLIVVGLAAISSDAALRRLRARRWKRLQRSNYLLAVLVVVHAVLYGALWRLTSPYTAVLGAAVAAVVVGQGVGVGLWRRRRRLAGAASSGPA